MYSYIDNLHNKIVADKFIGPAELIPELTNLSETGGDIHRRSTVLHYMLGLAYAIQFH